MTFARFRQPAIGALAVLLISGAGIAFAGSPAPTAPAAAAPTTPTVDASAPTAPAVDPLQQGDQTTPDAAAEQAAEGAATGTEKTGAEEPGDASLPGGGHADNPNDPNADHQFDGVE